MNLRLFIATLFALSFVQVEAQNIERASSVAYGQFVRKTMPLRDFPTVTPQEYRINEITIIENNLRANEKVNQQAYPQDGVDRYASVISGESPVCRLNKILMG